VNAPQHHPRGAVLLKRIVLGSLPPAFRAEHGEELWRSLKDEWRDARKRTLPRRTRALISAFVDLGLTVLMEWGVAWRRSVPHPSDLPQDLRWALRNVRHRPGLAAATILIMAHGSTPKRS
jgi:hypothetical protein